MLAKEIAELEQRIKELDQQIADTDFSVKHEIVKTNVLGMFVIGCVFGILSLLF